MAFGFAFPPAHGFLRHAINPKLRDEQRPLQNFWLSVTMRPPSHCRQLPGACVGRTGLHTRCEQRQSKKHERREPKTRLQREQNSQLGKQRSVTHLRMQCNHHPYPPPSPHGHAVCEHRSLHDVAPRDYKQHLISIAPRNRCIPKPPTPKQ